MRMRKTSYAHANADAVVVEQRGCEGDSSNNHLPQGEGAESARLQL